MPSVGGRTIGLFLRALGDQYQEALRDDCLATASRLGFTVRVCSADNDPEKQVGQINECIARHGSDPTAAIVVSPVRESVLRLAAFDAARAGIGCVVLNRASDYLESLSRDYPTVPLFCVTADQAEIGRIQGRQFRRLLPAGGRVFYVQGPRMTSSAQLRLHGLEQEIAGGNLDLSPAHGDWSADSGEKAARRFLRSFEGGAWPACLVGAQNDAMAAGARRALRAAADEWGRPEIARVPVTGCDGAPAFGRRLVVEGELAATVVIPSVAGTAVETLARTFEGGAAPPAEVRLPVVSYPHLEALHPLG